MERRRNEMAGKREIPEKTRRPAASSGTIPTCENPVTRPGIEPGPPWWEASRITTLPPWPRRRWCLEIIWESLTRVVEADGLLRGHRRQRLGRRRAPPGGRRVEAVAVRQRVLAGVVAVDVGQPLQMVQPGLVVVVGGEDCTHTNIGQRRRTKPTRLPLQPQRPAPRPPQPLATGYEFTLLVSLRFVQAAKAPAAPRLNPLDDYARAAGDEGRSGRRVRVNSVDTCGGTRPGGGQLRELAGQGQQRPEDAARPGRDAVRRPHVVRPCNKAHLLSTPQRLNTRQTAHSSFAHAPNIDLPSKQPARWCRWSRALTFKGSDVGLPELRFPLDRLVPANHVQVISQHGGARSLTRSRLVKPLQHKSKTLLELELELKSSHAAARDVQNPRYLPVTGQTGLPYKPRNGQCQMYTIRKLPTLREWVYQDSVLCDVIKPRSRKREHERALSGPAET
ncbi:hypothetical protein PR048_000726 [Dryococelus australis]|uniref:Uncharacterized protein n=1 Tax=Dryococelus australis TaxID=614101 RepID=A0ABQ9IFG2_9NEOP|nr:hypothetical protein PR048_000726 [Dryococelus australis]